MLNQPVTAPGCATSPATDTSEFLTEFGGRATGREPGPGRTSYGLSMGLAMAALTAGVATFVAKDSIAGPAVSVGTARGTALVVATVAVPVLLAAMWSTSRGSLRALVIWLGAAGYLLYNAVMFLFATPYNRFFLAYVAMFALALWSIGAVLTQTDVAGIARNVTGRLPAHGIAIYAWTVALLNALVWLRTIIPTITAENPGAFLLGSGFSTHPVYIQDLAIWIPLIVVSAAWLWRGLPWRCGCSKPWGSRSTSGSARRPTRPPTSPAPPCHPRSSPGPPSDSSRWDSRCGP